MQELEDDDNLTDHLDQAVVVQSAPEDLREGSLTGRDGSGGTRLSVPHSRIMSSRQGTHLGLGSCAIAAALLRNGHGRLTTIDIDPGAGYLIGEPWASVIDRRIGIPLTCLRS